MWMSPMTSSSELLSSVPLTGWKVGFSCSLGESRKSFRKSRYAGERYLQCSFRNRSSSSEREMLPSSVGGRGGGDLVS